MLVDVACGVLVCAYGQIAFWLMAAYRQAQKVRLHLFRSIMRQEIGWFDTHDAGELNTRLVEYVTSCSSYTDWISARFLLLKYATLACFCVYTVT